MSSLQDPELPVPEVLAGPVDLAPPAGALPSEKAALRKLQRVRVYAVLLINGHVVGRSSSQLLQPDFSVSLQSLFR